MEAETSNKDLNSFFQAMGEVDLKETERKHAQSLVSTMNSILDRFSRQELNCPIELEVFGSSAENLKFCLPNDMGDIDIMVCPVLEEAIIDDSVIEVVDDVSPMYVRLRGKNHPVFKQHCLENSDYVASSFLKEFDPKLFGDKTHFLTIIPKLFAKVNGFDLKHFAAGAVDNPLGPSVQLDVTFPFVSITERVQVQEQLLKEIVRITKSDGFRNFLEWTLFTAGLVAYIDEHLSTAVSERIQKFNEDPSVIYKLFGTLNQLIHGDPVFKITQNVQDIDERLANENSQRSSLLDNVDSTNPMNVDEDDSDSTVTKTEVEQRDTKHSEEIEDDVDSTTSNLSPLRQDLEDSLKLPNMEEAKTDSDGEAIQVVAEKAALALTEEEPQQEAVSTVHKKLLHYLVDSIFGKFPFPSGTTGKLAMEHHSKIIQSSIDLVPAIKAHGWPSVAKAWSTRGRMWPSKDIIAKILDSGFHIVVKAPPRYTDKPNQFFRLSFSRAELILSGELNNVQRECYRCLKIYYRSVIEDREPKIIKSYFLKTVLFWTVEETGSAFWTEDNRATCVRMLLKRLHQHLNSKHLPLYFIPEVNLLEDAIVDHPEEVEFVANEFRKIYENPMSYPNVEEGEHGNEKCTKDPLQTSQNGNRHSKGTGNIKLEGEARYCTLVHGQEKMEDEPKTPEQKSTEAFLPALHGKTRITKENDNTCTKVCASSNTKVILNGDLSDIKTVSITTLNRTHQGNNIAKFFPPRHCEFQEIYKEICKELIDLVLWRNSFPQEDPTVEAIIKNVRLLVSNIQNSEAELLTEFNNLSKNIYFLHVMHPGISCRQRILSALKGYGEVFSFIFAQDDILAEGNELKHLIIDRMLNSDTFDISNALMPNFFEFCKNILQVFDNAFAPNPSSVVPCDDVDIPLD